MRIDHQKKTNYQVRDKLLLLVMHYSQSVTIDHKRWNQSRSVLPLRLLPVWPLPISILVWLKQFQYWWRDINVRLKFCKETTVKRLNKLSRARDARLFRQHMKSTSFTPINNDDHTYTCADDLVVCQQVQIGQEADDLGKESEWRCDRRIVEVGM